MREKGGKGSDWPSRVLYIRTTYPLSLSLLFYPEDGGRRFLQNVNDLSRVLFSSTCRMTVSIVKYVDPMKCSFPRELLSGEIVAQIELVRLLIPVLYL
jgi:hypothetical protein